MLWSIFLATVVFKASRVLAATTIPPSLEGYYWDSTSSTWLGLSCPEGNTYVSWSNFARCCADSNSGCNYATSCYDQTLYYTLRGANSITGSPCASGSTCAIMTIYESATTDPATLDYFCYTSDPTWNPSTVFRRTDASAAPATSATAPTPNATSSLDNSQGSGSSGNKAWIAGAVIGPVAGCTIIAALAFWLIRRSRAKKQEIVLRDGPATTASTSHTQRGLEELDGEQKPQEMDGGHPISELPAPTAPINTGH